MNKPADDPSGVKETIGRALRWTSDKVSPLLAPLWPERYEQIYRKHLVTCVEQLPTLRDLPKTTFERGYLPLVPNMPNPPSGQSMSHSSERVWEALAQSPRVLITGALGSGKSTLLRFLAWQFAGQAEQAKVRHLSFCLFGRALDTLMPLWVDLRSLGEQGTDLPTVLLASLATHGFPTAHEFLRQRLIAGECVLLLDSLNEVPPARLSEIDLLIHTYPRNIWIVATRSLAAQPPLSGFTILELPGIAAIDTPVYMQHYLDGGTSSAAGILAICDRSVAFAELAQKPLMAAAMCRALRRQAVEAVEPVRQPPLLDACLQLALDEWPGQTGHSAHYAMGDKLRLLQAVAYTLQAQGCSELGSEELFALAKQQGFDDEHAVSLCEEAILQTGIMVPQPGGGYAFFARVLRSYLAAGWVVDHQLTDMLVVGAEAPWWQGVAPLVAGLLADPNPLLHRLEDRLPATPHKWLLLAHCIAEARQCDPGLQRRVADQLFALLEHEAAEPTGSTALWQQAAIAVSGMEYRRVKDYLGTLMRASEPEQRRRAALALGRLQEEWGIPSLNAAIADAEPSIRQQAAWALGYIPSLQAVRALPRALRSSSEGVRQAAARSFTQLAHTPALLQAVVQQLIMALDDDKAVASLAEEALCQIGPQALPQLAAALDDQRLGRAQRGRVAMALGQLGDDRALPVLIEALVERTRGERVRPNSDGSEAPILGLEGHIKAVAGIGAKAVPGLVEALAGKDITSGAVLVAALVMIGEAAVAPLIEAITGSAPEVRNAAVRALEQIGAPAVEPLTQALLHDTRFEVRRRALEILAQIGEEHAVNALIEALDDPDQTMRVNATRYLGNLGDARAVEPLIHLASAPSRTSDSAEELTLRRAALSSLSALNDARAVPVLLESLKEPTLREVASHALSRLGSKTIESLITYIHTPGLDAQMQQAAWELLKGAGASAPSEQHSLEGLASALSRLNLDPQNAASSGTPEEILARLENLQWWQYGTELHHSLATALALANARDLPSIDQSGPELEWLNNPLRPELASTDTVWLRPHIKGILWALKDVIEHVRLYHQVTRREAQRDALLSAIDVLAEVQERVEQTALPYERLFFDPLVQRWRTAMLEAIRQLRGRASIVIELLTPSLPVRATQHVVTAVLRLFNEGDGAARNLYALIKPVSQHGIEVVGSERLELAPLGIGEERRLEVPIAPGGIRRAELMLEAHYDDDERTDAIQRYSCHLEFYDTPSAYVPIETSPYIAGTPVKTASMFFGRRDILDWVHDNISHQHGENVLMLYGERRMGKTSVLYQLQQNSPSPQHLSLLFDLQLYSYINTVPELLFELAQAIVSRVQREGLSLPLPTWELYAANPYRAFVDLGTLIDDSLQDRSVLVMLDEFGVLLAKVRDGIFATSLFDFIRGIIQRTRKLAFLFTGAYEVRRMHKDFGSILFNMAKVRKISYLTETEATDLIEKPMKGILQYHPLVVQKIRAVTACHPYFVQYVCDELVQYARKEHRNTVELADLDYVLRDVVHDASGNIEDSIYARLNEPERRILAALANVTDDVRVFVPLSDIAGTLDRRHLTMSHDGLTSALRSLQERDLVTEMRIGQQLRYAFRMGLVRMWLLQNEMLLRLSQESGL